MVAEDGDGVVVREAGGQNEDSTGLWALGLWFVVVVEGCLVYGLWDEVYGYGCGLLGCMVFWGRSLCGRW